LSVEYNGDLFCSKCGKIAFETAKMDLNEIKCNLIDKRKISKIEVDIEKYDPREILIDLDKDKVIVTSKNLRKGLRGVLNQFQERIGIELTKYIEHYEERKTYDKSDEAYFGCDLYSIDRKNSEKRYIEVKTSFDNGRALSLTLNEVDFVTNNKISNKWIYAIFRDRKELVERKYNRCFELFTINCDHLKESDFGSKTSTKASLNRKTWRKKSRRLRIILNDDLKVLFERFREQFIEVSISPS